VFLSQPRLIVIAGGVSRHLWLMSHTKPIPPAGARGLFIWVSLAFMTFWMMEWYLGEFLLLLL
jgi:hypothetical protein